MDCGVGWRHSYSLEPREAVRKEMTQEWGSTAWRRRRRREWAKRTMKHVKWRTHSPQWPTHHKELRRGFSKTWWVHRQRSQEGKVILHVQSEVRARHPNINTNRQPEIWDRRCSDKNRTGKTIEGNISTEKLFHSMSGYLETSICFVAGRSVNKEKCADVGKKFYANVTFHRTLPQTKQQNDKSFFSWELHWFWRQNHLLSHYICSQVFIKIPSLLINSILPLVLKFTNSFWRGYSSHIIGPSATGT